MSVAEANSRQRAMERKIRAERSQLVALDNAIKEAREQNKADIADDLQISFDNLSLGLKKHEAVYKDFCKETGLPMLSERLQYPSFGRSISQKSVNSFKRLYKAAKGVLSEENMPKSVAEFAKICYNPQGNLLRELSSLSYENATRLRPLFNNRVVRSWYIHHKKTLLISWMILHLLKIRLLKLLIYGILIKRKQEI